MAIAMKSLIITTASVVALITGNVAAQTTTSATTSTVLALKPIQTLDCYKSYGTLIKAQEYDFASDGWCQRLCGGQNSPVMAMTAGSICYCGDEIPALDQVVPKSNCDSPCNGYNMTECGGFGYWQVYLTGLTNDVQIAPNSTTSSSSSATMATATKGTQTVVVTASASASATPKSSNKVGIAVGVVVGLVAIAAFAGGLVFFLKQRRKKAIEEEHRRLEAQAAALAAEKSDSASTRTDQRLDPSNIFSHRRESIGSIADEMDFSRKILQVRNPDRFSTNSGTA